MKVDNGPLTNGYTQICDKCRRVMCGGDLVRIPAPQIDIEGLTFAWYGANGSWINQVCGKCHLALRLEGVL